MTIYIVDNFYLFTETKHKFLSLFCCHKSLRLYRASPPQRSCTLTSSFCHFGRWSFTILGRNWEAVPNWTVCHPKRPWCWDIPTTWIPAATSLSGEPKTHSSESVFRAVTVFEMWTVWGVTLICWEQYSPRRLKDGEGSSPKWVKRQSCFTALLWCWRPRKWR